ncbi:U32 family peptidase [Hyphomicrobium sp. LHD-15]|uniref:ubiquinone anaerobic biosynthesis protein UbiV n=1 Tax=Hyphomicrobium sp. LHD-15 TaxID=3072142 RepID=UPI00280F034D|nr:U32 family peptidase [Hyphomicrobium sp. LHD-15]MDQ8698259.1 U32 family peptidase [Hyphomicrobium sp. LHD-15]
MSRISLTLGPVLFNWSIDRWSDFYARIADEAPIDIVYIGEVVCSKRQPFFSGMLPDVIERLERGGKSVILSSLALPTLERELRYCAALADASQMVEVNDVSMIPYLDGRPHAIGPFINVYNEATALFLADGGARRIVLPPELPMPSIAAIAAAAPETDIEVWAFGRIPLAVSARCYHARLHGRTKDSCQFVCENDPDGLRVDTLDDEKFLAINGVQTLSHSYCNLICETRQLRDIGVSALRLSPQTCDMVAVSRVFRDVLDDHCDPEHALRLLRTIAPDTAFSNGFVHNTDGALYVME